MGANASLPKPKFTFSPQIKGGTKFGGEKEDLATDSSPRIRDEKTAETVSTAAAALKSLEAYVSQGGGTSNVTPGKKRRTYRNKKRRAKKTGRKH